MARPWWVRSILSSPLASATAALVYKPRPKLQQAPPPPRPNLLKAFFLASFQTPPSLWAPPILLAPPHGQAPPSHSRPPLIL